MAETKLHGQDLQMIRPHRCKSYKQTMRTQAIATRGLKVVLVAVLLLVVVPPAMVQLMLLVLVLLLLLLPPQA